MIISTILTLIAAFTLYVGSSEGNWMPGVLMAVLALLSWFGYIVALDDAKAYVHRTSYWARSGKDRARLRHEWEAEASREEMRELERTLDVYEDTKRELRDPMKCPQCGHKFVETGKRQDASGAVFVRYTCFHCGRLKDVKQEDSDQPREEQKSAGNKVQPERGLKEHPVRAIGGWERSKMEDLFQTNNLRGKPEIIFCPTCGTKLIVDVADRVTGKQTLRHSCPKCGTGLWV